MAYLTVEKRVTRRQVRWLFIGATGIAVGVGVTVGTLSDVGLFLAPAILAVTWGILALIYPSLLLYTVIIVSASATVFREVAIPLGNTEMTLSGFLWFGIALMAVLYVVVNFRQVRIPRYIWPFIAFAAWAVIRWAIASTGFLGLKDLLWYSMPVLFGLFVPLALGKTKEAVIASVRRLEKVFLYSALIPVVLYTIALLSGSAEMTWRGPRGELVGAARGTPLYLLVVLAIALANWRHGPLKARGRIFSLVSLGTIFFTLARMASLLGLTALFISRANPRRKWQILASIVVVALIAFYAITHIPALEQRFFFREDWDPSLGLTGVNTAGRNIIWPVVYASALREPLIGHGPGSSRLVTAELFIGKKDVTEYHPHNEYLQVFHDLGVVGLSIIVAAWIIVFITQWKMWENGKRTLLAKWGLASTLATGVLLASSVTDNTLHYPFVVAPTIILVSVANMLNNHERT